MLAINVASTSYSLDDWAAFLTDFAPAGLGATVGAMAIQDVRDQAASLYRLTALGTEVILDRQGRIAFRHDAPAGEARLRTEIDSVQ